ncbi:uncharacterized protein [Ptychodera flava]|uniref:uncharacterized protein isoform X2 n=1 Tax=Ptychodera flava TaxID=63121 RepID=UPI00396A1473
MAINGECSQQDNDKDMLKGLSGVKTLGTLHGCSSVPFKYVVATENLPSTSIREFGRHLLSSESELETIEFDCSGKGYQEFKYQIVWKWILRNGDEATDYWFANALRHVGLHTAADSFLSGTCPTIPSSTEETGEAGIGTVRTIAVQERESQRTKSALQPEPETIGRISEEQEYQEPMPASMPLPGHQPERFHFCTRTPLWRSRLTGVLAVSFAVMVLSMVVPLLCNLGETEPLIKGTGCSIFVITLFAATVIAFVRQRDSLKGHISLGLPVELRQPVRVFGGESHEGCLKKIRKQYKEHCCRPEEPGEVLVQILNGLGGCGKTEIATRYVYQEWKKYTGGVFYICGQSNTSIDFGLKKLLMTINIHLDDDNVTPSHIRRLALVWLHKNKDWLLVIDDADDIALIATVFPSTPPLRHGHILLTSRVGVGWDNWYKNSRLLEVSLMSGRDSAIYLLREKMSGNNGSVTPKDAERQLDVIKYSDKEEYEALVWLGDVGGLHGHPLALRQASRYITQYNLTFSQYRRLYETCRLDIFKHAAETDPLAAWLNANGLRQDYASRFREVVQNNTLKLKSFTSDQLEKAPIHMEENDIVSFLKAQRDTDANFFALMLDPSRENFLTTWKLNYDKLCEDAATKEFILLCSCFASRIQIALLVDGAIYLVHGALRDHLKVHCGGDSRSGVEICQRVHQHLAKLKEVSLAAMVVGHHEEPHTDNELTRFGAFTVHHLVQQVVFLKFVTRRDKIRSLNNAMRVLEGMFPKVQQAAADNFEVLFNEPIQDRHLIIAIHTLALGRQIESLEKDDIQDLNNTRPLFSSVGTYLRRLGRTKDARLLYKLMARLSRWRTKGSEYDLADELRFLGKVNFELGRVIEAEECFEECLALYEKLYGAKDIRIAFAMQGVGRAQQNNPIYMQDGTKRKEIESLLIETLKIKREYYKYDNNSDHYSVAHALHQLGRFYQDIEDFKRSFKYLQDSLDMRQRYWERKYGTNVHVDIAISCTNLARNYLIQEDNRDLDKAEELLLKAWDIKLKEIPQTNDSFQLGLYYLAALYREKKNFRKYHEYRDQIEFPEHIDMLKKTGSQQIDYTDVFPPEKTIWL